MNCSSIDLKAYFLGELDRGGKSACDEHITRCEECHDELDRLRLTHAALLAMPDEEIPQRIAFVSDRVFEPRWWQTMWSSGPAMGFASAVLLACAILAHGYTRPMPVVTAPVAAVIDTAKIDRQIQAAVVKAVADLETRNAAGSAKLVEAAEKKFEFHRRADMVAAQETIRMYQQQMGRLMVAYNGGGGVR